MAKANAQCLKKIQRFVKLLEKQMEIKAIYLFGSHAHGSAYRDSDIDIAVVSSAFKKMKPLDRLVTLGKLAWHAKTPEIEAIGYTPEEFNKAPAWEFACEVKKTGVKVY